MKRAALVLFVLLVVGAGGLYFAAQRILGSDLVRRQIEEQAEMWTRIFRP